MERGENVEMVEMNEGLIWGDEGSGINIWLALGESAVGM